MDARFARALLIQCKICFEVPLSGTILFLKDKSNKIRNQGVVDKREVVTRD